MNHFISIIFRIIPLAMAAFCFGLGVFIYTTDPSADGITAGMVVFFLGSVCMALFTTAATIILQLIKKFSKFSLYFYPILSYAIGICTIVFGIIGAAVGGHYYVPGHVVIGLGLITLCISTVAKVSSKFYLIPVNSATKDNTLNPKRFSTGLSALYYIIPTVCSIVGWVICIILLSRGYEQRNLVAGSVVGGISAICTSLIGLVASIARQASNQYNDSDKIIWPNLVIYLGVGVIAWGIVFIFMYLHEPICFLGWILIGLGLICLSISSKIILLAKVWKGTFELANRIPLIPIFTALIALFISVFLFQWTSLDPNYYVPARVLSAFGAVCFTLFSIVSILESGTSK